MMNTINFPEFARLTGEKRPCDKCGREFKDGENAVACNGQVWCVDCEWPKDKQPLEILPA